MLELLVSGCIGCVSLKPASLWLFGRQPEPAFSLQAMFSCAVFMADVSSLVYFYLVLGG